MRAVEATGHPIKAQICTNKTHKAKVGHDDILGGSRGMVTASDSHRSSQSCSSCAQRLFIR